MGRIKKLQTSIHRLTDKVKNYYYGFTLIEILVVVTIIGLLSLFFTNIFFSTLKGGSKSALLTEVKQDGDYAIRTMEIMIRNASSLNCNIPEGACLTPPCTVSEIAIINQDGGQTNFSCYQDSMNNIEKIASNAGQLNGGFLTGNSVTLDQNAALDCDFSELQFLCDFPAGRPPNVTINYTLRQKGPTGRPEEQATVSFRNKISLRTY